MRKGLRGLALFAVLTALVIGVTWPWARSFSSGFVMHWDPPFHAWKLNLVAESILEGHLLPPDRNTNVFFPSSLTLYYEALHWPQAVAAAVLRLGTDNLVLVYHLVLVGFWALAGVCFFALCRQFGLGPPGALLGAAIFTVMPYRTSYLLEFNMQLCAGLVLFLFFFARFMREPTLANALGAALSFWFQAVSELYQALIALTVLPLLAAPYLREARERHARDRAWFVTVAVAGLAGAALCWYFLWPYRILHANEGFSRSLHEMETHFLEPLSYLRGFVAETLLPGISRIRRDEMSVTVTAAVLAGALLHAVLNRRLLRGGDGPPEPPALRALRWARLSAGILFAALSVALSWLPGTGAQPWAGPAANLLALAVLGSSAAIAVAARERDPAALARSGLAAAAALSFILSLGPRIHATNARWSTPNLLFGQLFEHLPLISGMRVVSRFSIIVLIFLVIAAVSGYQALWRRRPAARWVWLPVLAAVALEARSGPLAIAPFQEPWRSPAIEAIDRGGPATLLVIPFSDRNWDSQYMLAIAGSRIPLVYGWGGFYPPYQVELREAYGSGDVARGLSLSRKLWPEMRLLVDKVHLRGLIGGRRGDSPRIFEEELLRSCEILADDARFTLLRIPPDTGPAPLFERITRRATLRDNPVIAFTARAVGDRPVSVAVTVNDTRLAVVTLDAAGREQAVRVPAGALIDVRPNTIRVGSDDGAPFALEGFRLLPPR